MKRSDSKSPRVAARMRRIEPFHVMDVMARAHQLERQGHRVVHMEVGEPDFVTAGPIIEAGQKALSDGKTGYTAAAGIAPLREALAEHYRRVFDVDLSASRIVLTPGASGGLALVMGVLVNPGDRVLMADPGYPCNRHFVRLMGGDSLPVPVGADTGYQLTADHVQRHWTSDTVAVLLASPSNPTGTLVSPGDMEAICRVTSERGGIVIVDEIYQGLCYGARPSTVLSQFDSAFVVNSFSKYFGMTGWRLGWLVVPEGYEREVEKLAQNLFLAPSTIAQHAALAAFDDETTAILEQRRMAFQARRDYLLPALKELGFRIPAKPGGAFYLYADCSALADDSFEFCRRAMDEEQVAIAPGTDFGVHRAARHVRFAYTRDRNELEEGVRRLKRLIP